MAAEAMDTLNLERLIACPKCDAVYEIVEPAPRERAVCARCHTVLIAPRRRAGKQLIAMATTVLILIVAASVFPFLRIGAGGVHNDSSILDAAFAFSGPLAALSLAVLGFIVVVPMLRLMLLIYVLVPVVRNRPAAPGARSAFRFAESLGPWSMAEIFALGCAVALVKISDLAEVNFGPAFWMFAVLVVMIVVQDTLMCRYSVWKSLEG